MAGMLADSRMPMWQAHHPHTVIALRSIRDVAAFRWWKVFRVIGHLKNTLGQRFAHFHPQGAIVMLYRIRRHLKNRVIHLE